MLVLWGKHASLFGFVRSQTERIITTWWDVVTARHRVINYWWTTVASESSTSSSSWSSPLQLVWSYSVVADNVVTRYWQVVSSLASPSNTTMDRYPSNVRRCSVLSTSMPTGRRTWRRISRFITFNQLHQQYDNIIHYV